MRTLTKTTLIIVAAAMWPATAMAQSHQSRSAAPAQELTTLLDAQKLDAIAARDPDDPNRFIAALYFPGAQLLVVSAKYSAPAALQQRIDQKQYRDLYMDLQTATMRDGRIFVQDLQANGLRPTCSSGEPFDSVYESGALKAAFNGNWKDQKLTAAEYQATFDAVDGQYAKMLMALAAAARTQP